MNITIRYFASVREQLGIGQESVETAAQTLDELRQELIKRGHPFSQALGFDQVLRMAMNQQVCDGNSILIEGAEVAFFPPVTGG
jgi:molybdopterin synthase sulfur carrier subunit